MGTWNSEILGNDSAIDIYSYFEKLYNKQNLNIEEIKQSTLSEFRLFNEKNEVVYGNEQWLAYALICWECKAIDLETINIVENILKDKDDIKEDWEDLADERIKEIEHFYNKIQTLPKSKKRIKKEYIVDFPFKKGDCILARLKDGKHNIVILLDINSEKYKDEPNRWTYYFGTTRIFSENKPTREDILNSHFLVVNYGETFEGEKALWIEKPKLWIMGQWIGAVKNEKEKVEIEKKLNDYEIITNLNFETLPELGQSGSKIHFGNYYQLKSQTTWEKNNPNSIDLSYPIGEYSEKLITESKPNNKKKWKFWK